MRIKIHIISIITFLSLVGVIFSCRDNEGDSPVEPSEIKITATAAVITCSEVDITWSDNSKLESGFTVQRKTEDSDWIEIGNVDRNDTSFHDSGLIGNVTYYYRVQSYNDSAESIYSDIAEVIVLPDNIRLRITLNVESDFGITNSVLIKEPLELQGIIIESTLDYLEALENDDEVDDDVEVVVEETINLEDYPSCEPPVFAIGIKADADAGIEEYYEHRSDSEFCIIEKSDNAPDADYTWKFFFEDLEPGHMWEDWDYNDTILTVELLKPEE